MVNATNNELYENVIMILVFNIYYLTFNSLVHYFNCMFIILILRKTFIR